MTVHLISNTVRTQSVIKPGRRDKRGRLVCICGGYHFVHRQGGGACDHSKTRDIHMALRMKDDEALIEALIAHAFDHPGQPYTGPCPF